MAKFCFNCWNRINETKYTKNKYIISKDLCLCEGCGKYTNIIVKERNN